MCVCVGGGQTFMVDGTQDRQSAWGDSHIVGMKNDGSFAIEWQNHKTKMFNYNTYTSDGAVVATKKTLGVYLHVGAFANGPDRLEICGKPCSFWV